MATAGIIAASHATTSSEGSQTSSGMISMDPFVDVLPVKIFNDSGDATGLSIGDIADAINYARTEGADILSNSWSFTDPSNPGYPAITQACEFAYYLGRGGRGCPVIFSSGNTRWPYTDPNGVAYPSRLDECFAVGAVTLTDTRWGYSRYGAELDMVAPSDDGYTTPVWSLDQMGTLGGNSADCPPGANDEDYVCHFSGTSAACPVVAGTAALLLAKDSTLNAAAVYYILRNSAVTDLDWGTITPPNTQYGYGRVDAFRAILSISRGNIDNSADCAIDISDLVYLVDYRYCGGPAPHPSVLLADWNCDGVVDVSDEVCLIEYMFLDGDLPISPCFEFE